MPDYDPPSRYDGRPNRMLLPAGQLLWRLHKHSRKAATEFCRQTEPPLPCNRVNGPYPPVNAGSDAAATVAERLLLNVPETDRPFRTVRRARVRGMRASAIATAVELPLVTLLTGVDLSAVGQDLWLVTADECQSPRMARW